MPVCGPVAMRSPGLALPARPTCWQETHACHTAKSLSEIAKLQSEFVQKFAAQTTEQTKEFFDLSTRVTQHLFEKAQAAATKSFKSTF